MLVYEQTFGGVIASIQTMEVAMVTSADLSETVSMSATNAIQGITDRVDQTEKAIAIINEPLTGMRAEFKTMAEVYAASIAAAFAALASQAWPSLGNASKRGRYEANASTRNNSVMRVSPPHSEVNLYGADPRRLRFMGFPARY